VLIILFFGKTGVNHPKHGQKGVKPSHSLRTYVLNIKTLENRSFDSQRDAALFIGVSHNTIQRAMKSGKILKGLYVVRNDI